VSSPTRPPASLLELLVGLLTDPRLIGSLGRGKRTYVISAVLVLLGAAQLGGYDVAAKVGPAPAEATFDQPAPAQPAGPSPSDALYLLLNGLGLASMRSAVGRSNGSEGRGSSAPQAGPNEPPPAA